jgi:hypothetical protein
MLSIIVVDAVNQRLLLEEWNRRGRKKEIDNLPITEFDVGCSYPKRTQNNYVPATRTSTDDDVLFSVQYDDWSTGTYRYDVIRR